MNFSKHLRELTSILQKQKQTPQNHVRMEEKSEHLHSTCESIIILTLKYDKEPQGKKIKLKPTHEHKHKNSKQCIS